MPSKFIREFKSRSQVTIPKKLVKKLGLKPGDYFDIQEQNGTLVLTPSLIVPKSQSWFFSNQWQKEEHEVDTSLQNDEEIEVSSKEELFELLDLNE